MRKLVQVIGLIMAADGFLTTLFSKEYLHVWRTDLFGKEYREFIDSYAALPTPTLRVIGSVEILIGALLMFFTAGKPGTFTRQAERR